MNSFSQNEVESPSDLASFLGKARATLKELDQAILGDRKGGNSVVDTMEGLLESILIPAKALDLEDIVALVIELKLCLHRVRCQEISLDSQLILRLFSCRYLLDDLLCSHYKTDAHNAVRAEQLLAMLQVMRLERGAIA